MTKEQLRKYKQLRIERDKLARMLNELEATMFGPKAIKYDAMPRGGSGPSDPVAEFIGKHDELQRRYKDRVEELTELMAEIEQAIEVLDPLERSMIRLHYFQGFTWEQIALELNYTRRHVTRMHGRALEKLQSKEAAERCD